MWSHGACLQRFLSPGIVLQAGSVGRVPVHAVNGGESTMKTLRFLRPIVAALLIVALPSISSAHCRHSTTAVSQADADWWTAHGCQAGFFGWTWKAFHVNDGDDWSGHGFDAACTYNLEFPKLWSAAYLAAFGLADDYAHAFHFSIKDYTRLASGYSNAYHAATEYWVPTTLDPPAFGSYQWDCCDQDDITLGCLLFDSALHVNANPASRAGDFMHEGWHAYEEKYDYDVDCSSGHRCKSGMCTVSSCDYWKWHAISTYDIGQLYLNKTGGNPSHRPNQIQVEFLCDVNQYPAPNVPASVRLAAKADADTRAAQRFINGPGYKCGDPRPW